MGESEGMIDPEAKFFSSYEPLTGKGQILPFQKGKIGKKEGVTSPKQAQNSARQSMRSYDS